MASAAPAVTRRVTDDRTSEDPIIVAYTGEPGAFAEEAVLAFFAHPEARPLSSFRAVFEAVRDGDAAAGVVPVESSRLGTIRENLDLLYAFELPIVGEVSVPVRLALLALPGERLETIERVYSIAAALGQADEFLRSRPWTIQTTLQHGRCGEAGGGAGRARCGGRGLGAGREHLRARGPGRRHPDRRRQPDPVRGHRPARVPSAAVRSRGAPGGGRRRATDHARVRRPQRAGLALPLARSVRRSWAQPVAPGVPTVDRARRPLGVPVLGRPRRRSGRPACAAALEALRDETELVRILGTYPRADESTGSTRGLVGGGTESLQSERPDAREPPPARGAPPWPRPPPPPRIRSTSPGSGWTRPTRSTIANPARPGEPAGATYQATPEQYEQAVSAAAVRAFEVTRTLPAYERGRILRDISAGIKARREELGALIAAEAGKPIRDALGEVDRAVLTFRLGAEEAERMTGETIPLDLMASSKDRVGITRRFPIGPDRRDQPVQLPAQPRGPQGGAGHRVGQPDRAQAAVQGSAGDAHRGRDHRCRRRAGRLGEHPAHEPRAGRPDGVRRAVQAAHLHRQPRGRLADEGAGRQEEGRARAGWQRGRDRGPQRGPRLGGQADRHRRLRLQRPGVHQRPADVRPRGRVGHVHGPVRRRCRRAQGG